MAVKEMSDNDGRPEKTYEVTIRLSGSTVKDLIDILEQIQTDFIVDGVRDIISGGGWYIKHTHNPEQTEETYRRELREWIENQRVIKRAEATP